MVHVSGVVNMAMKWYGHFGKIGIASLNVVLVWLAGVCSIENLKMYSKIVPFVVVVSKAH